MQRLHYPIPKCKPYSGLNGKDKEIIENECDDDADDRPAQTARVRHKVSSHHRTKQTQAEKRTTAAVRLPADENSNN